MSTSDRVVKVTGDTATGHPAVMEDPIDFTLPDHAGGSFHLADALRERSVVVVFYRGDW